MSTTQLYPARRLTEQFEILKCQVTTARAMARHEGPYVLAFTSCEPNEGVTSVTVNFTASLVNDHHSHVLLVDGNLHKPSLQRYFMTDGNWRDEKVPIKKENEIEILNWQVLEANPYLDVILANHIPERYNRTLKMNEFGSFLQNAREKYDYVVIDCPPLNLSSGAAILSSKADAVVLVVESERVRREVIQRSVAMLEDLGANLFGVVLNKRRYPIPHFIYKML